MSVQDISSPLHKLREGSVDWYNTFVVIFKMTKKPWVDGVFKCSNLWSGPIEPWKHSWGPFGN
jgi:hypothetical protein